MVRYLWALGVAAVFALTIASTVSSAQHGRARMYVRLEVVNYSEWRKVFDGFAAARKAAGVTSSTVWQSVDDPNDVTIINDFPTIEQARSFAASGDLKDAMRNAGVKGPPQVWFATESR